MKKFSKIIAIFLLVLSLALFVSCDDGDKDIDNPFGEGVEGPIVDF